jgi:predicted ribosome quality control (RQC) complex YloA/Tae2 family protein
MHRNYFLFEKQVKSLSDRLTSSSILDCFTHRKNELVIRIQSQEEKFLRIGIETQTPYFLKYPVQRIKDPHTFFFANLNSQKIQDVRIIPFDKVIYIYTNKYILKCTFYGRDKNIKLLDSQNSIVESFKKISQADKSHQINPRIQLSSSEDLINFERDRIQLSLKSFMTEMVGGFNKLLSEEVCFRIDTNPDSLISEVTESVWNKLVEAIVQIKEEFNRDDCYIYDHSHKSAILSLVKLKNISGDYKLNNYPDVNTAWKQFLYQFQKRNNLDRILNQSRAKIMRRITYLEKTLKKVTDFKDLEKKKTEAELKGHLLQTFSSEIKRGTDLVRLKNIYSTVEEMISIKLDPKLSVQENALKYFNKYKDINSKKDSLKSKQDTYNDELNYWKKMYHESEKIDNLKKAEKLDQLLTQKKLIQKEIKTKKTVSAIDISSFNRVLLDGKWEILIGKNAENNDLLTHKFAKKHDIWMHAQGVPGSHVIVRLPEKNAQPPMDILKQAASIAAYFSNAKNSTTVPVNYTEVRYVRKPRKASAGTALITSAKTLFVEPKKYI